MTKNYIDALLYANGHLNVLDGHEIVQTYLTTSQKCMWREYNGQRGVKAEPCTISEFYKRIMETFND